MPSNEQLISVLEETGTIYNDGEPVDVDFGYSPGFSRTSNRVTLPKNVESYIGEDLSEREKRNILLDILNYYVERLQSGDRKRIKTEFAEEYDSTAPTVAGFVYRIVEDLWLDASRTSEYQGLKQFRMARANILAESELEEDISTLPHDMQLVTGIRQLSLTGTVSGIEQTDQSIQQFFAWTDEKLRDAQDATDRDKRKEIAAEITEALIALSENPRVLQRKLGSDGFKGFDFPSVEAQWQAASGFYQSVSGALLSVKNKVTTFKSNRPVWQQLVAVAVALGVFVYALFPETVKSSIPTISSAQNALLEALNIIVMILTTLIVAYIIYRIIRKLTEVFSDTCRKLQRKLQSLLPNWLLNLFSLPVSAANRTQKMNDAFWKKAEETNKPVETEVNKDQFEKRRKEINQKDIDYTAGGIMSKLSRDNDDNDDEEDVCDGGKGGESCEGAGEGEGVVVESGGSESPEIVDGFELSSRGNYESHAYDSTQLSKLRSHREDELGSSVNDVPEITSEIKDRELIKMLTNMFDTPPELRDKAELHGHQLDYRNVAEFFAGDKSLFDELYRNRKYVPGGNRIVGVSVDFSGSVNEMDTQVALTAIARAAQLQGDNFTAAGFTTYAGGPTDSRTQLITGPTEQFKMEHNSVVSAHGKTPLANGVDTTHRLLASNNATEKIMFVITDGKPNRSMKKSDWPSNSVASAEKAIEIAKTNNIAVIGFGVDDVDEDVMEKLFGHDGYVMTDSDDLAEELLKTYNTKCSTIR